MLLCQERTRVANVSHLQCRHLRINRNCNAMNTLPWILAFIGAPLLVAVATLWAVSR